MQSAAEEPPLGAHLVTPRRGFVHHGVYVGNGRVVHYAGFSRALRAGPVEEVSLERFAQGRGWSVRRHAVPRFAPHQVVERARSRLGENRYRVASNNCEHFVLWCLTGEARSPQVDAWIAPWRLITAARRAPMSTAGRAAAS